MGREPFLPCVDVETTIAHELACSPLCLFPTERRVDETVMPTVVGPKYRRAQSQHGGGAGSKKIGRVEISPNTMNGDECEACQWTILRTGVPSSMQSDAVRSDTADEFTGHVDG